MSDKLSKTGERVLPEQVSSVEEYLCYLRHRFAYELVQKNEIAGLQWMEIGSGEGFGASIISENAAMLVGLEINRKAVEHAQRRYGSPTLRFQVFDGLNLPFDTDSFDVVVSFQVIEHIENDRHFVSEAWKVLKPGGKLILTTPNRTYRLKPGQKPWNKYHVREYYPEELGDLLCQRFDIVKLSGVTSKGEVREIELAAVKKGFQDMDKLNLRHLLPDSVKPALANLARKLSGKKLDKENLQAALKKFSTADYFVIEENIDSSLDLLAICEKSK